LESTLNSSIVSYRIVTVVPEDLMFSRGDFLKFAIGSPSSRCRSPWNFATWSIPASFL